MTWLRRLRHRLGLQPMGHRGVILHLKGWAWVCYGVALITGGTSGPFGGSGATVSPLVISPGNGVAWGWLWVVCGLCAALTSAAVAVWPGHDRFTVTGWAAAIIPPIAWSTFYGYVWILHEATDHLETRHDDWWTLALFWAFVAWLVRMLAGWEEPVTRDLLKGLTGPSLPSSDDRP